MRSLSLNITLTALSHVLRPLVRCARSGRLLAVQVTAFARCPSRLLCPCALPFASPALRLCGVMQDHVYLTDPGSAAAVDVTTTLYVAQGQTYAVLNGVSIAIVLDHVNNVVFSPSGQTIGFILRIVEPEIAPAQAVYMPGASASRGSRLSNAKAARHRPSGQRSAPGSATAPMSVRNVNLA